MTANASTSPDRPPVAVIVMGASAGGLAPLQEVVAGLPPDLPAAVAIVMHVSPMGTSVLPDILNRASRLPVVQARDGEAIVPGVVAVATPDRHLVVENGTFGLSAGPREHGHRPALDALFRSAASTYGAATCGVVLSGTRDDGAAGLAAIEAAGGITLVQDPAEAEYAGMPEAALETSPIDAVLSAQKMPAVLTELAAGRIPGDLQGSRPPAGEPDVRPRDALTITCPECGGPLTEETNLSVLQFRCRVGHVYGPESLLSEQALALERALWTAARTLGDRVILLRRLAARAHDRAQPGAARRYSERADRVERDAALVRSTLLSEPDDAPAPSGTSQ